jgi:hypothetical protein
LAIYGSAKEKPLLRKRSSKEKTLSKLTFLIMEETTACKKKWRIQMSKIMPQEGPQYQLLNASADILIYGGLPETEKRGLF